MNRIREFLQENLAKIKTLEDVGTAFAVLALVFGGIGSVLDAQFMFNLAFAAFGAGIIAWGVNAIQRGEITRTRGFHLVKSVEGVLARAWGLLFVLGGLALMGHGILSALNPRSPYPLFLRQFFTTIPGYGVLLLIGSLVGLLFALSSIFTYQADVKNPILRVLLSIPGRVFGILLLIFFSALALVALVAIVQPATVDGYIQSFYQSIGIPPIESP